GGGAAIHRSDGIREYRDGRADGARPGRILVFREADPAERAEGAAGARGNAEPYGRGDGAPAAAAIVQRRAGGPGGGVRPDAAGFLDDPAGGAIESGGTG